ncbi:MAG: sulfur transferase domain-containing protein [bacterium]
MKNAKRYDSRITIGGVPDNEDLQQLKAQGYKTLIDLRDPDEKFGGWVERNARELGLRYVDIPISREAIRMEDVTRFIESLYEKGSAPIYAFSRFGRRPLALLLLFEAVAKKEHLPTIYRKASRFGLNLQGDLLLQEFLMEIYNSRKVEPLVESIRSLRPDLFDR